MWKRSEPFKKHANLTHNACEVDDNDKVVKIFGRNQEVFRFANANTDHLKSILKL